MDAPELDERNAQHICACKIVVGGDAGTVVVREAHTNPVPWPEISILQSLHGEDAVFDIKPIGLIERLTPMMEKQRMASVYGFDEVDRVYPGRSPKDIEWFAPGWPIDPTGLGKTKKPVERAKPPRIKIFAPEDVDEAV